MTKTFSFILAVSLCSTGLFADEETFAEEIHQHHHHGSAHVSEGQRMSMIMNFAIAGVSGLALKKAQNKFDISTPLHGALQVSNALWHLGSISSNDVLHDMSVRSLIATGATALSANPYIAGLAAATPYIGEGLKTGAHYTQSLLTVSAHKAGEMLMKRFCDSARNMDIEFSACAGF